MGYFYFTIESHQVIKIACAVKRSGIMKLTAVKCFTQHISHRGTDVNFLLIRLFVKIKAKCVKLRSPGKTPALYASYAPIF